MLITASYLFRGEYLKDKNNYVNIKIEDSIYKIVFDDRKFIIIKITKQLL